jgi:hypothetical protein
MAVRIRKPVKPQFDSVRAFLFERAIFAYMSSVATTNLKMHLSYC